MDVSGKNRYELLYMDDDTSAPAAVDAVVPSTSDAKKKELKAVPVAKKNQASKKPNVASEKENKSAALNKNEFQKIAVVAGNVPANRSKACDNSLTTSKGRSNVIESSEGGRSVGFSTQNNDNREQRPRRNVREGGFNNFAGNEYNNDQQRPQRQFRDREYRGPQRSRNGEIGFRSGKREFDRQSGSDKTGVKAVDKRDGAGAHNWGSAKQDIDDINKSNTEADAVLTDREESANEQSAEQVTVVEEEETKELTLDEWKALRQTRNKPQYNLRKAGEGEDTTQWKKMVALNKKKDGDSEEEFEYDPSMYPQRVGRLQRIVDIQFNFNDGRRGGFGGFGRGRGRGGARSGVDRPRYETGRSSATSDVAERPNIAKPRNIVERPAREKHTSLKVDDERQFPTLS